MKQSTISKHIKITQKEVGKEKQKNENKGHKHKTNKMVDLNPCIFVITLKINGLNVSLKRQRLSR